MGVDHSCHKCWYLRLVAIIIELGFNYIFI